MRLAVLLLTFFGAFPALAPAQSSTPRPSAVPVVAGNTTVRATRIAESVVLDGRLEESIYSTVTPIGEFLQQEPVEGEPATEKTEVWLLFDDKNIYVSARCEDSHPERDIANEMRRDSQGANDNESLAVIFDTFHDRRNAFMFQITLAGGLSDGYVTDEREMNRDWNTVWDARTARFDGGWTAEMVIPFKSLRYNSSDEQIWGVNFKRIVKWKNETQYLTRIPAALGRRGLNKVSSAATMAGIETPRARRNYEVKPYAIGGWTTDRPVEGTAANDAKHDVGLDSKIGVTAGLTADFTYNTDFAQVEEDEQQANLTRFNVLFPEKRDFFLEGQGIFSFGGLQNALRGPGGGGGGGPFANPVQNDIPVVFFSRRIGLNAGHMVPIDGGARLSGKAGPYSIGLLDIRTGKESIGATPATNFGVVRIKRDILRRSAIGFLYTDRSRSAAGSDSARSVGIDGVFSFFQDLNLTSFIAKTMNPGVSGRDWSYRTQLDYNADRYGLQIERLSLDENFKPDVGFLRRSAFTRNSAYARFSPRPRSIKSVRKFSWDGTFDYITNPSGRLESRLGQGAFRAELQNGDHLGVEVASVYEFLEEPFEISKGVVIPPGGYSYPELHLQYTFGTQRKASGGVTFEHGSFYNGTRSSLTTMRPRIEITSRSSVEPGLTVDRVDLPEGRFTSLLMTTRTSYTFSPRSSLSALMQYNSSARTFSTNIRFRWEYQPGSDFFVVYSDGRDTTGRGFPELRNRGVVLKLTRLFRL